MGEITYAQQVEGSRATALLGLVPLGVGDAAEKAKANINWLANECGRLNQTLTAKMVQVNCVKEIVQSVDSETDDPDELKDIISAIADEVGCKNPFLIDVSDIFARVEEVYSYLDDLKYTITNVLNKLDDFYGELDNYQNGYSDLSREEIEDVVRDTEDYLDDRSTFLDYCERAAGY